jgi:hypothetical protein
MEIYRDNGDLLRFVEIDRDKWKMGRFKLKSLK